MVQVLKPELQDAILAAARQEFLDKGFHGATLRAIAQKAGCSAGNLYAYFRNKDDLFTAVVEPRWIPLNRTLDEILPSYPGDGSGEIPFEEKLDRVLRAVEFIHRNRDDFSLILLKSDGASAQRLRDDFAHQIREDVFSSCMHFQRVVPHVVDCDVSEFFIDNVAEFHLSTLTKFLASDLTLDEMKRYATEMATYVHYGFRSLYERKTDGQG
ncbi:MAG: TetR/AcrR family transcriptional regulator [bacterium]|nr:TetR/AcrR family transcriptional regulator [bacterium]